MSSIGVKIVGVIIYLIGCLAYALGPNLQKYALTRDEQMNDGKNQSTPFKIPLWLFGVVIYVSSGILWAIAVVFTPVSQLTPFLSSAIVLNLAFARFINHEELDQLHYIAAAVIIASVVLMGLSSTKVKEGFAVDEDLSCQTNSQTLSDVVDSAAGVIWVFLTALVLAVSYFGAKKLDPTNPITPLCFGCIAGLFGGLTTVAINAVVWIFKIVFDKQCVYPFGQIFFAFSFIFLVVFEIQQLVWINLGLSKYDAAFIATIEILTNQVSAATGSLFLFAEYRTLDGVFQSATTNQIIYFVNMVVGIVGCVILAFANDRTSESNRLSERMSETLPIRIVAPEVSEENDRRVGLLNSSVNMGNGNFEAI